MARAMSMAKCGRAYAGASHSLQLAPSSYLMRNTMPSASTLRGLLFGDCVS